MKLKAKGITNHALYRFYERVYPATFNKIQQHFFDRKVNFNFGSFAIYVRLSEYNIDPYDFQIKYEVQARPLKAIKFEKSAVGADTRYFLFQTDTGNFVFAVREEMIVSVLDYRKDHFDYKSR